MPAPRRDRRRSRCAPSPLPAGTLPGMTERRVVISVDMEGVCGVSSWVQVSPPEFGGLVSSAEYERARERMTLEAAQTRANSRSPGLAGWWSDKGPQHVTARVVKVSA